MPSIKELRATSRYLEAFEGTRVGLARRFFVFREEGSRHKVIQLYHLHKGSRCGPNTQPIVFELEYKETKNMSKSWAKKPVSVLIVHLREISDVLLFQRLFRENLHEAEPLRYISSVIPTVFRRR